MDSYVSYLEDMPAEKVRACEDKVAALVERLQRLKERMHG